MFSTLYPADFEFGKVYSQVRTDVIRGKILHHIVRIADDISASGWREFGYGHQLNEKCVTCCTWSDDEFKALDGEQS